MLQTGHGDARGPFADHPPLRASLAARPAMPVVNGEVCYEALLGKITADVPRLMFWTSILSGAAGHTYGANGIWQLNRRDQPYGKSPHGGTYGPIPWDEAMRLPGSRQLGLAKKFLGSIPGIASSLIRNGRPGRRKKAGGDGSGIRREVHPRRTRNPVLPKPSLCPRDDASPGRPDSPQSPSSRPPGPPLVPPEFHSSITRSPLFRPECPECEPAGLRRHPLDTSCLSPAFRSSSPELLVPSPPGSPASSGSPMHRCRVPSRSTAWTRAGVRSDSTFDPISGSRTDLALMPQGRRRRSPLRIAADWVLVVRSRGTRSPDGGRVRGLGLSRKPACRPVGDVPSFAVRAGSTERRIPPKTQAAHATDRRRSRQRCHGPDVVPDPKDGPSHEKPTRFPSESGSQVGWSLPCGPHGRPIVDPGRRPPTQTGRAVVPVKAAPFELQDVRLLPRPASGMRWSSTRSTCWPSTSTGCCTTSGSTPGCPPPPSRWGAGKSQRSRSGATSPATFSRPALMFASTGDARFKAKGDQVVAGLAECHESSAPAT